MALSAMPLCSICINAAEESYIRFSLGHFLGFTDVVISYVKSRLSASDCQALAKADLYHHFGGVILIR